MICSQRVKIQCPFRTHIHFGCFPETASLANLQCRPATKLVPKAQPEISQTRSVWYHGKRKFVLKGRRKYLDDDCVSEIPSSLQDESICASNPDTSCLANFRRRAATKLCRINLYAIHAFKPAFSHRVQHERPASVHRG